MKRIHSLESIHPGVAHFCEQSDYGTSQNAQHTYIFPYISQKTEATAENDPAAVLRLRNPPKKPPATPHRRLDLIPRPTPSTRLTRLLPRKQVTNDTTCAILGSCRCSLHKKEVLVSQGGRVPLAQHDIGIKDRLTGTSTCPEHHVVFIHIPPFPHIRNHL